ncbi:MAG: hypothetical protein WC837_05285 [Bellilinea sp.]
MGYFITAHGFGHAARASAVMQALQARLPNVHFDLFTQVPEWFFRDSVSAGFTYHNFASDVGLVQTSPFSEDLPATLAKLTHAKTTAHRQILQAAKILTERQCRLVVCDIAPVGIQAAHAAGLPAVLVENFTWDFIYAGYTDLEPGFIPFIQDFEQVFSQADLHIQAVPAVQTNSAAQQVQPVARRPVHQRADTRERLGVAPDEQVILVTVGGIEEKFSSLTELKKYAHCRFVLPGTSNQLLREDNLILLPHRSNFYHPDLVQASNAVIAKLGYSTVAEVYQAGLPFAYIPREKFPETPPLAEFAQCTMGAFELNYSDFSSGNWGNLPEQLLQTPKIQCDGINGADEIADLLLERYSKPVTQSVRNG